MSNSTLIHSQTSSQSVPSGDKLRVLTPSINASENQYLTCLWSSVGAYGVEVDIFEPSRAITELKAEPKLGDVLHLQWIQRFCGFNSHQKLQSLRFIIGNLRNFIFLKKRGYQLVWTIHNTLAHDCEHPMIERLFRWCLSHICDDIIVMSEYGRREVAQLYGRTQKVHVIPHGNYIGAYPNQISRAAAREQLQLPAHHPVLLYVGQIKPYKGVDHLIAAFQKLQHPEAVLLIAGSCADETLRSQIQQAAQANPQIRIHLHFVPDDQLQVYLNACDWVVLPYRKILNSGSALMALSFGRPVIVPQRGALGELITEGQQGFCYDCDRDLTATLKRALSVPAAQWQHMCNQSYVLAQQYDWSVIGAKLAKVYRQGRKKY